MDYLSIKEILSQGQVGKEYEVKGWIRSFRNNQFVALSDGSTLQTFQLVLNPDKFDETSFKNLSIATSVSASGKLAESLGQGQKFELIVDKIVVLGHANSDEVQKTILQPKRHSLDFLREQAHLRFRTQLFGAVFRVRHHLAMAIHDFFDSRGFFYLHAPIITASDAEGAGEMFQVTSLDLEHLPQKDGRIDYEQDFFAKKASLSVSGQLQAELAAMGLGKVYTFGPTFRAENSNTSRHLAEFWMIEPEAAFMDLAGDMDLAEAMLKHCLSYALEKCADDIAFLDERLKQEESQKPMIERSKLNLIEKLKFCIEQPYQRLTYREAIDILMQSTPQKKGKFKYPVRGFGTDLQSEHERYLVETHFERPVILTDYPREIKAFYMRLNDDQETVAAMDILFPGIGEIVGGSQREERLEVLVEKMKSFDISEEEMSWYLDSRRFGTVPHAGFGLGFERLVMFVTGLTNIRDVIPFARTPKNCHF
ncbi:MAG: asparagine--tRNA ligase [Chitinophagales bacterium]|jgi:asparaginyl-tRNA synthetase|nr:asparagine--tRNA ligase [Chitinophagales bacterium]